MRIKTFFPEVFASLSSGLIAFFVLMWVPAGYAKADSPYLFYLEAQAVAGYSENMRNPVYQSMNRDDVMQKPSLGFDYLHRLSSEGGDWGAIALQARFAYNDAGSPEIEPQLYNAYFKYKAGIADLWAGHNRPAFGLSSYFDSHALLLPTLSMLGFGFDRDWGIGAYREFQWGTTSLTVTTGSGMGLHTRDNYLVAARVSKGFLSQDNYTLGFSAAYGDILDVMGYELMMPDPVKFYGVSTDFTYLWNNFESRFDIFTGKKGGEPSYAFLWRLGVNLADEGRLKLEVQPVYHKTGDERTYQIYGGISYQLTADLTARGMYMYEDETDDQRVIFQLYGYSRR